MRAWIRAHWRWFAWVGGGIAVLWLGSSIINGQLHWPGSGHKTTAPWLIMAEATQTQIEQAAKDKHLCKTAFYVGGIGLSELNGMLPEDRQNMRALINSLAIMDQALRPANRGKKLWLQTMNEEQALDLKERLALKLARWFDSWQAKPAFVKRGEPPIWFYNHWVHFDFPVEVAQAAEVAYRLGGPGVPVPVNALRDEMFRATNDLVADTRREYARGNTRYVVRTVMAVQQADRLYSITPDEYSLDADTWQEWQAIRAKVKKVS